MTFNNALKNKIYMTIMREEETSELDKYRNERQALVSARELLCVARKREERRKLFVPETISELQKDLPYVKDITIVRKPNDSFLFLLLFGENEQEPRSVGILVFSNGITKPLDNDLSMAARSFVENNQALFRELANFARENAYNNEVSLNTRSQCFNVQINDSSFDIRIASRLFKGEFYLIEDFMRDGKYNRGNIVTSDGDFRLETDIYGVKKLFLRPRQELVDNYYHGEKDPTLRFLNHLQVYESDLPPYLKEEVGRVRRR